MREYPSLRSVNQTGDKIVTICNRGMSVDNDDLEPIALSKDQTLNLLKKSKMISSTKEVMLSTGVNPNFFVLDCNRVLKIPDHGKQMLTLFHQN